MSDMTAREWNDITSGVYDCDPDVRSAPTDAAREVAELRGDIAYVREERNAREREVGKVKRGVARLRRELAQTWTLVNAAEKDRLEWHEKWSEAQYELDKAEVEWDAEHDAAVAACARADTLAGRLIAERDRADAAEKRYAQADLARGCWKKWCQYAEVEWDEARAQCHRYARSIVADSGAARQLAGLREAVRVSLALIHESRAAEANGWWLVDDVVKAVCVLRAALDDSTDQPSTGDTVKPETPLADDGAPGSRQLGGPGVPSCSTCGGTGVDALANADFDGPQPGCPDCAGTGKAGETPKADTVKPEPDYRAARGVLSPSNEPPEDAIRRTRDGAGRPDTVKAETPETAPPIVCELGRTAPWWSVSPSCVTCEHRVPGGAAPEPPTGHELPTKPPDADTTGNIRPVVETRPTVVCLCGSTRFKDAFTTANRMETLVGRIVVGPGLFGHSGDLRPEECEDGHPTKTALDELHKRKIDLADEVLVLNVSGYIGDSTRSEIEYAERRGKRIRWLESPVAETCDRCEGGGRVGTPVRNRAGDFDGIDWTPCPDCAPKETPVNEGVLASGLKIKIAASGDTSSKPAAKPRPCRRARHENGTWLSDCGLFGQGEALTAPACPKCGGHCYSVSETPEDDTPSDDGHAAYWEREATAACAERDAMRPVVEAACDYIEVDVEGISQRPSVLLVNRRGDALRAAVGRYRMRGRQ